MSTDTTADDNDSQAGETLPAQPPTSWDVFYKKDYLEKYQRYDTTLPLVTKTLKKFLIEKSLPEKDLSFLERGDPLNAAGEKNTLTEIRSALLLDLADKNSILSILDVMEEHLKIKDFFDTEVFKRKHQYHLNDILYNFIQRLKYVLEVKNHEVKVLRNEESSSSKNVYGMISKLKSPLVYIRQGEAIEGLSDFTPVQVNNQPIQEIFLMFEILQFAIPFLISSAHISYSTSADKEKFDIKYHDILKKEFKSRLLSVGETLSSMGARATSSYLSLDAVNIVYTCLSIFSFGSNYYRYTTLKESFEREIQEIKNLQSNLDEEHLFILLLTENFETEKILLEQKLEMNALIIVANVLLAVAAFVQLAASTTSPLSIITISLFLTVDLYSEIYKDCIELNLSSSPWAYLNIVAKIVTYFVKIAIALALLYVFMTYLLPHMSALIVGISSLYFIYMMTSVAVALTFYSCRYLLEQYQNRSNADAPQEASIEQNTDSNSAQHDEIISSSPSSRRPSFSSQDRTDDEEETKEETTFTSPPSTSPLPEGEGHHADNRNKQTSELSSSPRTHEKNYKKKEEKQKGNNPPSEPVSSSPNLLSVKSKGHHADNNNNQNTPTFDFNPKDIAKSSNKEEDEDEGGGFAPPKK